MKRVLAALVGALLAPACFVSIPDYHATGKVKTPDAGLSDASSVSDARPTNDARTTPRDARTPSDAGSVPDGAAVLEVGGACNTPQARACADDGAAQLLVCSEQDRWDANGTCGGATPRCVAGQCFACTADETSCDGETPRTCSGDGTWKNGTPCADPTPLCAGGLCVEHCTDGQTSCSGKTPRVCQGGAWVDGTPCSGSAPTCVGGECTGTCAGSDVDCAASTPLTCVSGAWKSGTPCSGDTPACLAGACVACIPEAFGCEGNVVRQCSSDKRWVVSDVCASPTPACFGGACTACSDTNKTACAATTPACLAGKCVACDPGSHECDGDTPSTCSAAGAWVDAKSACSRDCAAATGVCGTCSDGVKSADETAIDCGGTHCGPCDVGQACSKGSDCASASCKVTCQAATCSDGVVNQGESGVDCGGSSSCRRCVKGETCAKDSDCTFGACTSLACSSTFPYKPSNFSADDAALVAAAAAGTKLVVDCGTTRLDVTTGKFTNACHGATPTVLTRTQPGGPPLAVVPLSGLTVSSGSTLLITGTSPALFAVYGNATISGTVWADYGSNPATVSCAMQYPHVGGAFGTIGGGSYDEGVDGVYVGAAAAGEPTLVPLRGGCPGDSGGDGGNAVQISVSGTLHITSTGVVAAPGASGGLTGGGGSGGALLLEAMVVSSDAGGWLTANGGGGGCASSAGQDGSLSSATPAPGNPPCGGLAGTSTNAPVPYPNWNSTQGASGSGGGGGSVGRIRVNGTTCTLKASASPAPTTACGTTTP